MSRKTYQNNSREKGDTSTNQKSGLYNVQGSCSTIVVDAALSAAAAAKNDRDCFIAPRATRWSTGLSPLIIMITRWAMGWVR